VVMLKPELFRVAIDTTEAPVSSPLFMSGRPETVTAWTHPRCTWHPGAETPAEVVTEAE
jgi:hypothetical protein